MFLLVPAILLLTSFCVAAYGDVPKRQAGPAPDPYSLEIEEILRVWESRESTIEGVSLEWEVTRQLRSATFGLSDPAIDESTLPVIGIRVQEHKTRLEGNCLPPDLFREISQQVLPSPTIGELKRKQEFQLQLDRHFEAGDNRYQTMRYLYQQQGGLDLHYWCDDGGASELFAKCPAGDSPASFEVPIIWWLADAFRCAAGDPRNGNPLQEGGSKNFQIVSEDAVIEDVPCVIVTSSGEEDRSFDRKYWVEKLSPGRVRRCLVEAPGNVIYQLDHYTKQAIDDTRSITFPKRIYVLQLSSTGEVFDELVVRLRQIRRIESASGAGGLPRPEVGAIGADFTTGKRMIARDDGTWRALTLLDRANLKFGPFSKNDGHISDGTRSLGWIIEWLIFPSVLVPLFLGLGLLWGLKSILWRSRRYPSGVTEFVESSVSEREK